MMKRPDSPVCWQAQTMFKVTFVALIKAVSNKTNQTSKPSVQLLKSIVHILQRLIPVNKKPQSLAVKQVSELAQVQS